VEAPGVDEVLFARQGRWRTQAWSTSIVDVAAGQLPDVIEGRSAVGLCTWLAAMPAHWRDAIRWAVLDLSGPWRLAFEYLRFASGQTGSWQPRLIGRRGRHVAGRPARSMARGSPSLNQCPRRAWMRCRVGRPGMCMM
jgi:hypothetical protein